jgi:hypothetical protein
MHLVVSQALGHMLHVPRRKMKLIEGIAKCRHLKDDLSGDFAAGVNLSMGQNPIHPPLHTVYVYSTQGRGEMNQREG